MHSTDSDDKDTCTLLEWATGPLLLIALMAFAGGFVYGVLRHFFPTWFN